jgi:hypothetical protein
VPYVRSALEDALVGVTDRHIGSVFMSNEGTLSERAYLLGRLSEAGATSASYGAVLRLSPFAAVTIKENYSGKFDQGKRFQEYELRRTEALQRSVSDVNLRLVDTCEQVALLAEGTGQAIARLFRTGRKPEGSDYSSNLASTDLYGVDLSNLRLNGSIMSNCVMRHASLDSSQMGKCDLEDGDFWHLYSRVQLVRSQPNEHPPTLLNRAESKLLQGNLAERSTEPRRFPRKRPYRGGCQ